MTTPGERPNSHRNPRLTVLIATWFGTGRLPYAPGTWGSLAALPVAWILQWAGGWTVLAIATAIVFGVGWWAASRLVCQWRESDPSVIVIDEVAGQWAALLPAALDPIAYLAGFAVFRIADIAKPWPASWADRRVKGGLGVMLDDVIAAVYAGLAVWLVSRWLGT